MTVTEKYEIAKKTLKSLAQENILIPCETEHGIFGAKMHFEQKYNEILNETETYLVLRIGDWRRRIISWTTAYEAYTGEMPPVLMTKKIASVA